MCRILLVRTSSPEDMQKIMYDFSKMCEKSRTMDNDRQEDGWGVSWINEENEWEMIRSLKAIWKDTEQFKNIPLTRILVAHARSTSFPQHKNVLDYNQPYINENISFVFNGNIRGMRVKKPIPGKIGAQKIFSLIKDSLTISNVQTSLKLVYEILVQNSKQIVGLNIGVSDKNSFYLVSHSTENHEYFSLYKHESTSKTVVCSEPIGKLIWAKVPKEEIIVL